MVEVLGCRSIHTGTTSEYYLVITTIALFSEAIVNQLSSVNCQGELMTPETGKVPRLIYFYTSMEEEDANINQKLIELISR